MHIPVTFAYILASVLAALAHGGENVKKKAPAAQPPATAKAPAKAGGVNTRVKAKPVESGKHFEKGMVVVMEQETVVAGQPPHKMTTTMKVKGRKKRADMPPFACMISDAETGDVISLMPGSKSYRRQNSSASKEAVESMKKMMKSQGKAPKLVATGEKKVINGMSAECYRGETPAGKQSFWVVSDVPHEAEARARMEAAADGATVSMAGPLDPPPGFVVRMEMENEHMRSVTTVHPPRAEEVADSEFEIPEGYTEIEVPGQ